MLRKYVSPPGVGTLGTKGDPGEAPIWSPIPHPEGSRIPFGVRWGDIPGGIRRNPSQDSSCGSVHTKGMGRSQSFRSYLYPRNTLYHSYSRNP